LSKEFRMRLRHALKYSTEKVGFSWNDKQSIFNELPRKLRYEVALAMHQGAIKSIYFFQKKDPVFISTIVPFLQNMFIAKGQFVYKEGEYADEMYFVTKGRVSYVYGRENTIYKTLGKGAYFGDIEVIEMVQRKYTIQACQNSELLIMHRSLVSIIAADFPIIYEEMKKLAKARDEINKRGKEEMKILLRLKREGVIDGLNNIQISAIVNDKLKEKLNEKKEPRLPRQTPSTMDEEILITAEAEDKLWQEIRETKEKLKLLESKLQRSMQLSKDVLDEIRLNAIVLIPNSHLNRRSSRKQLKSPHKEPKLSSLSPIEEENKGQLV
jgi:hypothetical protein